ncbi:MAG: quinol:cytochrome C oxidoreductase [Phycisphaerales bacterium]|nr:quinol:cytochrome C oxidoreductase [Phycisphaerales bacterium]
MSVTLTHAADLSNESVMGDHRLVRFSRRAFAVGTIALIGAFALAWRQQDAHGFAMIWLQSAIFILTLGLGAFFFTLLQHATGASWGIAVRRVAEAQAANLQWIGLLFIVPMIWLVATNRDWHGLTSQGGHGHGLGLVWPWADLAHLTAEAPAEAALVAAKSAYLNTQFFLARACFYCAFWAIAAGWFFRTSRKQDHTGDPALSQRMRMMAFPTLILFALTSTFAAVDWIMSLSPAWFSTMFGVYFFCGICAGGFSVIALACLRLQSLGYLRGVLTAEHYQDLGKFIWAFGVVFWAYIAFSQYMLIWYGNLPEETVWFLARQVGDWSWVSIALLFGHFVIPFVFFISRWMKRWRQTLAIGAVWMLAFAWIDLYWLVMPVIPADVATFNTYDELAQAYAATSTGLANPVNYLMLVGFLGLFIGSASGRLATGAVLCRRDPRLNESLNFENI